MVPTVKPWQKVWRKGIAPQLSTEDLCELRGGLKRDDRCLIQGSIAGTTTGDASRSMLCEMACAIGYIGWRSRDIRTISGVEEYFAAVSNSASLLLGDPNAMMYFLSWFDQSPRKSVRSSLLEEIDLNLKEREACQS